MIVLNARMVGRQPPDSVYVGRPSPWGNPYVIGRHGSRAEVLARYSGWLDQQLEQNPALLDPLKGKDLVCWCAPLPCHADELLERMGA
jgi:hypothetical protein